MSDVDLPVMDYLGSVGDVQVFHLSLDGAMVGLDRENNPTRLFVIKGATPQWAKDNREALGAMLQKVTNER